MSARERREQQQILGPLVDTQRSHPIVDGGPLDLERTLERSEPALPSVDVSTIRDNDGGVRMLPNVQILRFIAHVIKAELAELGDGRCVLKELVIVEGGGYLVREAKDLSVSFDKVGSGVGVSSHRKRC